MDGRARRLARVACAGIAIVGCRSMNRDAGQLTSQYAEPVRRPVEANLVKADDLARADGLTLDEALRQVRPEILRPNVVVRQASADLARPAVYLDDRFLGGVDALRLIPVDGVVEVRLVKPFAARGFFGADCACAAGVIAVTTRARLSK